MVMRCWCRCLLLPRNLSVHSSFDSDVRSWVTGEFVVMRLQQVPAYNRESKVRCGAPAELRVCGGVRRDFLRREMALIAVGQVKAESLANIQPGGGCDLMAWTGSFGEGSRSEVQRIRALLDAHRQKRVGSAQPQKGQGLPFRSDLDTASCAYQAVTE